MVVPIREIGKKLFLSLAIITSTTNMTLSTVNISTYMEMDFANAIRNTSDNYNEVRDRMSNTEVNIHKVIIMIGNFNIRDSLWDLNFPFHSSHSNTLFDIANSFSLEISKPTKNLPIRFSDNDQDSNSVLDLVFLCHSHQNSIIITSIQIGGFCLIIPQLLLMYLLVMNIYQPKNDLLSKEVMKKVYSLRISLNISKI